MCLDVTYLPSLPKNGESLIVNNILMVGSSILIVGKGSGFSKSAIVSPISKFSNPTTEHISPASTESTFNLPRPSKTFNSLILDLTMDPSLLTKLTFCPCSNIPLCNLPIASLPVKEE